MSTNPAAVERAQRFRALHDRRQILLLPNAWDAGSARLFEDLGFAAVATTRGRLRKRKIKHVKPVAALAMA